MGCYVLQDPVRSTRPVFVTEVYVVMKEMSLELHIHEKNTKIYKYKNFNE
jgi:hypothetical protein